MALPKQLSLWIFLLFSTCIATGSPVRPVTRRLDEKQHATTREHVTRRLGGTTPKLQMGGMCAILTHAYSAYKCADYEVQTKDGYILSLANIRSGLEGLNVSRQPVVLQHGIMTDGMSWFLNPPAADEALGCVLADAGFDVWVINTRGTRFSRRHVTLDHAMPDFWNWSWDQLSQYDLPAALDFVLDKTKIKMHYIAHSMGATQALAAFSEGREIEKLKSASFLCPVAYLSHMGSLIASYACKAFLGEPSYCKRAGTDSLLKIEEKLTFIFGLSEFNLRTKPVANFMKLLCQLPFVNCFDTMDAFTGPNCCLNNSQIRFVLDNTPQPTSAKCMVHFAQLNRDGKFRKFDYGSSMVNNEYYGQPEPPVYDLKKIPNDFPIYISHGALDFVSDPEDVNKLLNDLKGHDQSKLKVQLVHHYAHVDFVMGTTAKDVVYAPLVRYLKSQA